MNITNKSIVFNENLVTVTILSRYFINIYDEDAIGYDDDFLYRV